MASKDPPFALTEKYIAALERAIHAEGYEILIDPLTNEITLEEREHDVERATASADSHAEPDENPQSGRPLRLMTGEESMAVVEKRIVHQKEHPELYEEALHRRHEGGDR